MATYKLSYNKGTSDMVYETTFPSINEATSFGHTVTGLWLLFEQKATAQADSSWKLLPYGNYESYQSGIMLSKFKVLIFIIGIVALAFVVKKMIG